MIWKLIQEQRKRAELRAFLQQTDQDAYGQGYSGLSRIGDRK